MVKKTIRLLIFNKSLDINISTRNFKIKAELIKNTLDFEAFFNNYYMDRYSYTYSLDKSRDEFTFSWPILIITKDQTEDVFDCNYFKPWEYSEDKISNGDYLEKDLNSEIRNIFTGEMIPTGMMMSANELMKGLITKTDAVSAASELIHKTYTTGITPNMVGKWLSNSKVKNDFK
jgi:hypothetical protein